jgi:cell division protein ZapA
MAEVTIMIGGRSFEVACQDGEEHFLHAAAALLNAEATALSSQIGRMPEPRMLLMSGLMLADKTAGLEERLREVEEALGRAREEIRELQSAPRPEPERIEVPVVPDSVTETLQEIAARAEALAAAVEERSGAS